MVIEPKVRGFICTTAHPAGCAKNVEEQIACVRSLPAGSFDGAKAYRRVLLIGGSTGYGLATRIAAAFGAGAATLSVAYEKPAEGRRTATAGWYNTAAFEREAQAAGLYARSLMGDAFSQTMKEKVIDVIRKDLGQVDLVIYSLAAPRRTDPQGVQWSSVLKPIGQEYRSKTIDMHTREISEVSVPAAAPEEITGTVKVMGGEDWRLWMEALLAAGVLAEGARTAAYSYIGPKITHAVYRDGTVGQAKLDLERTAGALNQVLAPVHGRALVSVNKAVVTQASSAIPVVPLYISILFKIMKEAGSHEGCIEQMARMLAEKLPGEPVTDAQGRIRMDDRELSPAVQAKVDEVWARIDAGNLHELADVDGYWQDFYRLFGFGLKGVDYGADIPADVPIPSLKV